MSSAHTNLDRILLPLDGSESAASIVPYVERLALGLGSSIHLLGVLSPIPAGDLPNDLTGTADVGAITQYIEIVKNRFEGSGLPVEVEIREGQASVEILESAAGHGCGLVALSTRGRSATGPNLLGITTDRIIRSSSIPVFVIPPDEDGGSVAPEGGVKTIVVGVDGSETATASLGPARQIARKLGVDVVIVRSTPPPDPLGGAATYFDSVTHHAEQYVTRVSEQFSTDGLSTRTVVGSLSAHEQLLEAADEADEPLLILSTRGWSNRADWQLGSVTDRVVRTAKYPVLIIPPAGRG